MAYFTSQLINQLAYLMTADHLSTTFAALADPTRRAILGRLASGERSVNELAKPFKITLPGISKHLKVLERAGLITRSRNAQWRPCRLEARPLKEVATWVDHYRRFWEESFDRLDEYLQQLQKQEEEKCPQTLISITEPADRVLVITRIFDAPPSLVFQAWTQHEHLVRWCAPHGFTITYSEGDVRPGGRWRSSMRAPTASIIASAASTARSSPTSAWSSPTPGKATTKRPATKPSLRSPSPIARAKPK